jgi:hypothetical protein
VTSDAPVIACVRYKGGETRPSTILVTCYDCSESIVAPRNYDPDADLVCVPCVLVRDGLEVVDDG